MTTNVRGLIERAAEGDARARRDLLAALSSGIDAFIRANPSMIGYRGAADFDDHVRQVYVHVSEKVSDPRKLQSFLAWQDENSDKSFQDWLNIVTKNAIRTYLRKQLGPRVADGETSAKRLLAVLGGSKGISQIGQRPQITNLQLAKALIEFARKQLPAERLAVFERHLDDAAFADIEHELGLAEGAAEKHWRAAVQVLRRRFRE